MKPTLPGQYHWRPYAPFDWVIVDVKRLDMMSSMLHVFFNGELIGPVRNMDGEFVGPLTQPHEPGGPA